MINSSQRLNRTILRTTAASAVISIVAVSAHAIPAFANEASPEATIEPAAETPIVEFTDDNETIQLLSTLDEPEYLLTENGDTKLYVQKDISGTEQFRIKGSGWQTTTGGGSTIAIKLNYRYIDGTSGTYSRTGEDIVKHPVNNNPEPTIWDLITVSADGTFDLFLDAPPELVAGQRLVINVASGLTGAPDVQRSLTSSPITVGGIPWVDDNGETITCVPSTPTATYSVASAPNADGTLSISGTGWCNSINGGAIIAFKIDDGTYQRLNNEINSNLTIWDVIQANPETGDWSINLQLPDGTTSGPNGSNPAFTTGEHRIRMLSGSLKDGDPIRAIPAPGRNDTAFVVGEYRPSEEPGPLHFTEDLTETVRNGVSARLRTNSLDVNIPNTAAGDWVFVTLYQRSDGAMRKPWTQWFQTDANGDVQLPISDIALPTGRLKVVAQSGNQGESGRLLGWDWITVSSDEDSTNTSTTTPTSAPEAMLGAINSLNSAIVKLDGDLTSYRPVAPTQSSDELIEEEVVITLNAPAGANSAASANRQSNSASVSRVNVVSATASGNSAAAATAEPSEPQPTTQPEPAVDTFRDLITSNVGTIEGSQDGAILDMVLPDQQPGDWVYLYLYSTDADPKGLGWVQVDDTRRVSVNGEGLPSGVHKVSISDSSGNLLGWAELRLTSDSAQIANSPATNNTRSASTPLVTVAAPLMGSTDWALIIGAVALVELLIIGTVLGSRRRNR